jgi:hypothetical protein
MKTRTKIILVLILALTTLLTGVNTIKNFADNLGDSYKEMGLNSG